jgi:hypothetical protein
LEQNKNVPARPQSGGNARVDKADGAAIGLAEGNPACKSGIRAREG